MASFESLKTLEAWWWTRDLSSIAVKVKGNLDLQVACFPFEGNSCPPLLLITAFCEAAFSWLKAGLENVVVVHCKRGMARTGLMISCLLLHLKVCASSKGFLWGYWFYLWCRIAWLFTKISYLQKCSVWFDSWYSSSLLRKTQWTITTRNDVWIVKA